MSDFERIRPSALAPVNTEVPYVVGMTCRKENWDFESVVVFIEKRRNLTSGEDQKAKKNTK
jgi:hypothetical protein